MMDLKSVKGIGDAMSQKLSALGITTVYGLLSYLPTKYIDLKMPVSSLEVEDGQFCLLEGNLISFTTPTTRGTKSFVATVCDTISKNRAVYKVVFYNQPYYANVFENGKTYRFFGKAQTNNGVVTITNPTFEPIDKISYLDGIYTVYSLKGEIGQRVFKNIIRSAFALVDNDEFDEFQINLIEKLKVLHSPTTLDDVKIATEELSAVDLAAGLISYKKARKNADKPRKVFYKSNNFGIIDFKNAISFNLTQSQEKAINDIFDDLNSSKNMSRIVSGDVGSGKSVVAYASIIFACLSNHQAVYMAPTEILATQQFEKFSIIAKQFGINCALLTSSISSADKKTILKDIENGNIQAIFGTQSVISDNVKYLDLSLAVADEQHKFGVSERAKLEDKGANDILTLTATPIPRTLALTIYDDIDVSTIEKRENSKTNITTKTVSDGKLADLLFYIKKECESGKQAFIVCPSIKDSEGVEIYSIEQFKKEYLQIFSNLTHSILTGKMSSDEKNQAMRDFSEGKTQLMVATSVIEVGIDTKASIIAVLNADRFGFASLHQLRGRVGRDGSPAYCFLHYKHLSEKGFERLSSLEKISDGLLLAEKDLDMRGAGDILGARQSGISVSPWLGLPLNFNVLTKAKLIEKDNPDSVCKFTKALGADYSAFADNLQSVTLNS